MRKLLFCLVIPAFVGLPAAATAGELKLTIDKGLVTLLAQDVPLSAIMAEWARIGQTRVINGEKILTPVSLQLVQVPERKALDILLRSASGYMLAERTAPITNASAFDRIMILPTSHAPVNTAPVNVPPPAFNNVPRPIPAEPMPDMDDDGPDPNTPMPPGTGPQAAPGQPELPGTQRPELQGNVPLTLPRPGQLPAPAPQQPVPVGAPRPPGSLPGGPGGTPGGSGGPGGPGGETV